MGLVTKKAIVCNRCGASTTVEDSFYSITIDSLPDGWHGIDRDRALCPECYSGYDLLMARHKVEIEDYISNAD